jgi:hypothetical protein
MIRLSATLPSNAATGKVGAAPFTIDGLFAGGVKGYFYDINDTDTLKSNTAGTTAAAVGGPVGKIMDKSPNSNDQTAYSDTRRATLARRPINTVRRNKYGSTGGSEDWTSNTSNNVTYSKGTETSPLNAIVHTMENSDTTVIYKSVVSSGIGSSSNMTVTFYAKLDTQTETNPCNGILILETQQAHGVAFNLESETVSTTGTVVSTSLTAVSGYSGWYKCSFTVTGHNAGYYVLMTDGSTTYTNTVAVGNKVKIQGFQMEQGNSSTNYQKVNGEFDVTEDGIATVHYLAVAADAYSASSVTHDNNKMTVVARAKSTNSSGYGTVVDGLGGGSGQGYRMRYDGDNDEYNGLQTVGGSITAGAVDQLPLVNTIAYEIDRSSNTQNISTRNTLTSDSSTTSVTASANFDNNNVLLFHRTNQNDMLTGEVHKIIGINDELSSGDLESLQTIFETQSGTV